MGEPETPHCYDFGIVGSVYEPQDHFLSLQTPEHLKQSKKNPNHFEDSYFHYFIFLEIRDFENVRKDGRRKIPPVQLIKS